MLPAGSMRFWGWLKRPSILTWGITPFEALLGLTSLKTTLRAVLAADTSEMRAVRNTRVAGFHWAVWLRLLVVAASRPFWTAGMSHASGNAPGPAGGMMTATAMLQRVKRGTLSLRSTVMVLDWQGNLELCDMSAMLSSGATMTMGLLSLEPGVSIAVDTIGMPLAAMLTSRMGSCVVEGLKTVNVMTWRASLGLLRLFCLVPPLGRQQSLLSPAPILKAVRVISSAE
mmetsp:Transcript_32883/g.76808  ORF Transcript_32883/g.76808 Transcript_32883/m.76808 type:complete len:228 (-) Transcript_32883:2628-3311(-)